MPESGPEEPSNTPDSNDPDRYEASANLADELIISIGCVGGGRYLKNKTKQNKTKKNRLD